MADYMVAGANGEMPQSKFHRNFPPLDPKTTAVVVVDMINHQVTPSRWMLADFERDGISTDYIVDRVQNLLVPNHQRLLSAVRRAGGRVAYVRVGGYTRDHADLTPGFQMSMVPTWNPREGSFQCEVIDAIAPEDGDLSIIKSGSGGFHTSALDILLRNMGIKNILYTGVITNGCVLLTVAAGFDLGYNGYLVADATATFSQRLQDISEEIMGGYMAKVVTTDEIVAQIDAAAAVPA